MKYKLSDICSGITDGSHNPPAGISNSDYLMLSSKNIYDDKITFDDPRYLSEEQFAVEHKRTGIKPGDVLMTIVGTVGRTAIVPDGMTPITLQRSVAVLHPIKDICLSRYLMYVLRSKRQFFESEAHGVAQKGIYLKQLSGIVVDVPYVEKQKEVVQILDFVQSIIKKRYDELDKLDELVKARFVEMFELDDCKWGSFGENTDFVDYRGHTPELSGNGTIRMINAKSVGKGVFKYIEEYVTDEVYNSWMHRGFGYPGDVLFVTEGHTFGNTCRVPNELKKFALGQRVITIKAHEENLNNAFLCAYMQTDRFWNDINVYRTGGTAQGIRSKDLIKVKLPLAPLEDQQKYAAFVDQVDKTKDTVQKSLDETQMLFDSLMQQYFG